MSEVEAVSRNKTDSNVPVTSEAGRRRRSRHASVGSCVGVSCLALRHAALLCTVLPRITSTIDPNALDAEPIKRPLVRLRHPPPIPHRPRAFYCGPNDRDYIGFATLPEQVHRKSVKRGFEFTLMVLGESGLGKSTLINSLFLGDLYKDRRILDAAGWYY
ncbi:Septin-4 [Apis cerana cerana]|uniref:Septin-4 n=1 Tax=Apis cerana cerana TaxID=94128 RepID=A0A2A3E1K8_APICC|nr:Septin-4 [Apis cerana cerana]